MSLRAAHERDPGLLPIEVLRLFYSSKHALPRKSFGDSPKCNSTTLQVEGVNFDDPMVTRDCAIGSDAIPVEAGAQMFHMAGLDGYRR